MFDNCDLIDRMGTRWVWAGDDRYLIDGDQDEPAVSRGVIEQIYGPVREAGFVTNDSGERLEFASGMVRDTSDGKTLWHLVASGPMLRRWAELLTRGAVKYTPNNWMMADGREEFDRFRESAFRHFMQWYLGLDLEEDHAAAILFNVNGAEYVRERMGGRGVVSVGLDGKAVAT